MLAVFVALLAGLFPVSLRADFSYQDSTRAMGGALYTPLPRVSTKWIKGNRMAEVTKEHVTVIDLDKETVTEMDLAKKTYSAVPFVQIKQMMPNTEAVFKASGSPAEQTKMVGVLKAKETIWRLTAEDHSMVIVIDAWLAPVPGYDEVRAFGRKLGAKMGYAFGSAMWPFGMGREDALVGFAEAAKEMNHADGAPLQTTVKIVAGDAAAAPEAILPAPFPPETTKNAAGAALSRLGMGPKKRSDQPRSAGSLIEILTELTNLSLAPMDAAKFEVPQGFKEVPRRADKN